jgi:hypothetical protein
MSEGASYRATSRPYAKQYGYKYRRHVFDKLRALDWSSLSSNSCSVAGRSSPRARQPHGVA